MLLSVTEVNSTAGKKNEIGHYPRMGVRGKSTSTLISIVQGGSSGAAWQDRVQRHRAKERNVAGSLSRKK
jgi:hypothetical protein